MRINCHLPKLAITVAMMIGATVLSSPGKATSLSKINDMYVFGDSLSDTGQVLKATNGLLPPNPPYFNGRFADGLAWVEYLATDLGFTLKSENNFAFGGATTGFNNIALPDIISGLQQQVNSFTSSNTSANQDALYIIWAGTNDYLDFALFGADPNPRDSVANLATAVRALVGVGAKNIMVVNLPDLGKFPVTGGSNQVTTKLSDLVAIHNSELNQTLNLLRQEFTSDIDLIDLDVYALFNQIIASPAKFGLTDVQNACIGELSVVPVNFPRQPVDCVPSKFLFFDEVHPTSQTNKILAKYAFSRLHSQSIPENFTPFSLLIVTGIGIVYYRQKMSKNKIINN